MYAGHKVQSREPSLTLAELLEVEVGVSRERLDGKPPSESNIPER